MMVLMLIGATYSSTATVTSAAVARTLIMRVTEIDTLRWALLY